MLILSEWYEKRFAKYDTSRIQRHSFFSSTFVFPITFCKYYPIYSGTIILSNLFFLRWNKNHLTTIQWTTFHAMKKGPKWKAHGRFQSNMNRCVCVCSKSIYIQYSEFMKYFLKRRVHPYEKHNCHFDHIYSHIKKQNIKTNWRLNDNDNVVWTFIELGQNIIILVWDYFWENNRSLVRICNVYHLKCQLW